MIAVTQHEQHDSPFYVGRTVVHPKLIVSTQFQ